MVRGILVDLIRSEIDEVGWAEVCIPEIHKVLI